MKKSILTTRLIALLTVLTFVLGCTEDKFLDDLESASDDAATLKAATNWVFPSTTPSSDKTYSQNGSVVVRYKKSNKTWTIEEPGTYIIDGKVEGNIDFSAGSGTITLQGNNDNVSASDFTSKSFRDQFENDGTGAGRTIAAPAKYKRSYLFGLYKGDGENNAPHFNLTGNSASVVVKNISVFNDGGNAFTMLGANHTIQNVCVISSTNSTSRSGGSGGGGISLGNNGLAKNCYFKIHDDALKMVRNGSTAENCVVDLVGSGCAVQWGWYKNHSGQNHLVDGVDVYGWINAKGDQGAYGGKAVVAGSWNQANGAGTEDYVVKNLRVHKSDGNKKYSKIVRFKFKDAVVIPNVSVSGTVDNDVVFYTGSKHSFVFWDESGNRTAAKEQTIKLNLCYNGGTIPNSAIFASNHINVTKNANCGNPPVEYTIDASSGNNGSITPSGSVNVSEGGNQSFTISPDNNYVIQDVVVDGNSVGAVSSYTFNNVQANHTIHATFEADDPCAGGLQDITDLTATVGACSIGLDWTPQPCATEYIVRRKVSGASTYDVIANLPQGSSTYTDNNVSDGVTYIYMVRPFDGTVKTLSNTPQVTADCGPSIEITVTNVVKDCNGSGEARNVIYFTVTGTTATPTASSGTILADGANWKLRDVPVNFGSTKTYTISAGGESIQQTVTAVSSCN